MFCPVCENAYDETFNQCPTCGSQLVADLSGGAQTSEDLLPFKDSDYEEHIEQGESLEVTEGEVDPIPASELPELMQVFAGSGFAPDLIRSVLEGSGISVLVKGSGVEGVYGGAIDTRIYVREGDAQRAREVIASAESGEFEIFEDE